MAAWVLEKPPLKADRRAGQREIEEEAGIDVQLKKEETYPLP